MLHCRSISVKVWKSCLGYNSSICTLWPLSIQPKIPEISIRNQMEQTILVRSNQNIWDHLHRWSTLTGLVHLTKVLSPVLLFSILLTRTMTKLAMAWVSLVRSGLCNWNLQFQWAHGISEISNRNFCWVESALYVFVHLSSRPFTTCHVSLTEKHACKEGKSLA